MSDNTASYLPPNAPDRAVEHSERSALSHVPISALQQTVRVAPNSPFLALKSKETELPNGPKSPLQRVTDERRGQIQQTMGSLGLNSQFLSLRPSAVENK